MAAKKPQRAKTGWVVVGVLLALGISGGFLAALFAVVAGGPPVFDADTEGAEPLPEPETIAPNSHVTARLDEVTPTRLYHFSLQRGGPVTISATSDFDNYLELYDATTSSMIAEDDDGGEGLNALIRTTLGPGGYQVLVRPYSRGRYGDVALTIIAPLENETPAAP